MLGISCDHAASHRAWATALGGLPYPELSDWEPKGQVSRAYNLWNPERGASIRAVLIIDKDGVIRYRRTYSAPNLPDLEEIMREVEKICDRVAILANGMVCTSGTLPELRERHGQVYLEELFFQLGA